MRMSFLGKYYPLRHHHRQFERDPEKIAGGRDRRFRYHR